MFGHKKVDPKEAAREAKRSVRSGERDVEKELRALDRTEKALILDIKKAAKRPGGEKAARTLAKQLVGLRAQREKMYQMKSNITSVGYSTSAMAANANMAGVLGNVAGVMKDVNDSVSAADTAKIMAQFAQQNEMMGLREELIDDALIDAFDGEGVEEESDAIVNQVLTEIGLDVGSKMAEAPSGQPAGVKNASTEEEAMLDQRAEDLLKQLQAL